MSRRTARSSRPRSFGVWRACSAVLAVAGVLAIAPAARAAPGAAALLITAAHMPAGWQQAKVPTPAANVPFVPQCAGQTSTTDGRTSQALVAFRFGGGYPSVVELVATYPSARAAFQRAVRDLGTCIAVAGPGHSKNVRATVSRLSFPRTGDQSIAFRTSFDAAPGVDIDNVVLREGGTIAEISLSTKGVPNSSQLRQFVRLGINSIVHAAPG